MQQKCMQNFMTYLLSFRRFLCVHSCEIALPLHFAQNKNTNFKFSNLVCDLKIVTIFKYRFDSMKLLNYESEVEFIRRINHREGNIFQRAVLAAFVCNLPNVSILDFDHAASFERKHLIKYE